MSTLWISAMEFRPAVEAAARRAESTGPGNMLNYVEQCPGRDGMVFPPGGALVFESIETDHSSIRAGVVPGSWR